MFFLNKKIKYPFINIGSGKDFTIKWYANFIATELGASNLKIIFDKRKPDGMPRKLLDVNVAKKLGWRAKSSLKPGLKMTLDDYITKIN